MANRKEVHNIRGPEIRGPETELERTVRNYLGSADPESEGRQKGLIAEILRESRPLYELAEDLLRARSRQYDLDTSLINREMVQATARSLRALASFAEYIKTGRVGGKEEKLVEIRGKVRETLTYIDNLILGKLK